MPAHRPRTSRTSRGPLTGRATRGPLTGRATRGPLTGRATGGPLTSRTTRRPHTTRAARRALPNRADLGAVTAELAIALPVLLSLLLLGIWTIGLVVLNIQCIDAARDVARAVARGEPPDQAKALGHRTIPTSTITITREASDIRVTVTATPTHNPPLLTLMPPTRLTATATLQSEPETS